MDREVTLGLIGAIVMFLILLSGVIYFVILYRRKQEEFRKERETFEQALLKTKIEIKEATLGHVSRDLHDNLGQIAASIKINLSLINSQLPTEQQERIDDSKKLLSKMMTDIKSMSTTLKGENVQLLGLAKMIELDVERMNKIPKLDFKALHLSDLPQLSTEKEVFLYRMTQESLNNILKHAKATEASVSYHAQNERHQLIIYDNGIGIAEDVVYGNGLQNMKTRCEIIGAKLEIKSSTPHGTTITITF